MPSIETQQKMHAFFMKTSAPRILQEMKKEAASRGITLEELENEKKLKERES